MIIDSIKEKLDVQAKAESASAADDRAGERDVNHASELGWLDDCTRRLVLVRTVPEKEVIEDESRAIFREGRIQEGIFSSEMIAAGAPIIPALPLFLEQYNLKGVADDLLSAPASDGFRGHPIDYKSCSRPMFGKIRRMIQASDFENAKQIWLRHYIPQMYGYMALYNSPVGILAFRNKENGQKHFVELAWSSKGQDYLTRLLEIEAMVKSGTVPEASEKEACSRCGFKDYCFEGGYVEPLIATAVDEDIEDDDLAVMLDRRAELEPARKEYEKLDEEIKGLYEGRAGAWRISRRWIIENHPYATKSFKVPDAIKAQYETTAMRNKFKIHPAV